ncbi:hypothetical protein KFE94_10560 [bacterium SCSIO 12643]|nr:hypothetical protein KFE94_10560 [bacterium SCSIO 12643]
MRKNIFQFLVFGIFFSSAFQLSAQVSVKDSAVFAPIIDFSYAYKIPGGDLDQRFGDHSEIGVSFLIKSKKNFLYGVDWNYIFGNKVKDLSFTNGFRDANGGILGTNGLYSEIYFVERGFTMSAKFGQIFNVFSANPNSGIMLLGGVGLMQHRIKFEDKFNEVPLLSGKDYYPGYDRLSNGVMFTEFLGYRLLSDKRLINVFMGVEFTQAITQNRREINYDTGLKDDTQRLDLTMGLKIGLSLPLYKPTPQEFYYR